MNTGFATGFGVPNGLFSRVSAETMNSRPCRSKLTVKKSPSLRSPAWKLVFALHAVPCRQMGPTWIGRLDAFVTENCGGTNRFDPSEHVTVVPWAFCVYAA